MVLPKSSIAVAVTDLSDNKAASLVSILNVENKM